MCNYTRVFRWPSIDEASELSVAGIDINDIADVSNNWVVGKFLDVVVQLPNLRFLDLRFNEFEGELPRQVFERNLDALFINNNIFSSKLPDSFGNSPVSIMAFADQQNCLRERPGQRSELDCQIFLSDEVDCSTYKCALPPPSPTPLNPCCTCSLPPPSLTPTSTPLPPLPSPQPSPLPLIVSPSSLLPPPLSPLIYFFHLQHCHLHPTKRDQEKWVEYLESSYLGGVFGLDTMGRVELGRSSIEFG
ncbi:hypothetical protein HAX54_025441 [Datura stramonium]|uniref:Uncharacterized protein n=1 Tax=Datura stramonium TaxID=4076 RepID=A0ABS8S6F7_DATST|nr:hypothetical protein [Datura stramonium]